MEIATGNYLNVFSEINHPGDKERDIIVLFNEPNSQPTGEELAVLADMIVAEVEKDPTGANLQSVIEDSGMECVAFGVQVFAFGMDQPVTEKKVRRGRKPAYMSKPKTVYAFNIEWDVDDEEDLENLPKEIEIPEWIEKDDIGQFDEDAISDYLSNVTGFCHKGFKLTTDPES